MVIARIFGGLGNQLFIYAAARRLAWVNQVPLQLDISGYQEDYYKREYCLHHFNIQAKVISPVYAGTIGKIRRRLGRQISQLRKFANRSYICEEFPALDPRLLHLQVKKKVYLDGYWQSERYFKDAEEVIRADLQIATQHAPENLELAKRIRTVNAVALHARRLHGVPQYSGGQPSQKVPALHIDYYRRAIELMASKVANPFFFCFGDYPQWLQENLKVEFPAYFITHNGDDKNYEDLWLMSLCKHFIIANSTFGWWGAWLSNWPEKIVIAPAPNTPLAPKGTVIFSNRDYYPEGWINI
jgi:hypothetical protein